MGRPRPPTSAPGTVRLWLTERRRRVATKTMDRRFAVARVQAGLPAELTLHCLRHSCHPSDRVRLSGRFVTEQVGHSYASTTAIYTSVSDDFKTKTLQAALRRVYGSSTTTGEGGDEH